MTSTPENPPAFPGDALKNADEADWILNPGMSLRDWFAGQALAGLAHQEGDASAKYAYFLADAMLAERERTQ